jgi:hypothetical protein
MRLPCLLCATVLLILAGCGDQVTARGLQCARARPGSAQGNITSEIQR